MNQEKKHIYFVPGLAANPLIFEYIKLPADLYEMHFLEWLIPENENESIEHYAERMAGFVKHPDAILVGVSFGGVMVQEMKQFLHPQKVIIISSVKNKNEMPLSMRIAQKTNAYKLFPYSVLSNIEQYEKYAFVHSLKHRIELYKKYLSMRDSKYLPWAVQTIINWNRTETDPEIAHIHGTDDFIFPHKFIKNFIRIENGTHIMILNKAKKISALLEKVLDE